MQFTDNTPETYGGPFFVPEVETAKGITTEMAADMLAEPGLTPKQAAAWFRNQTMLGRLHPYGRLTSDGRKPYLFRDDQVFAAAILHRMREAGLGGDDVVQPALLALNHWDTSDLNGQEPPAPKPLTWVLRGIMAGYDGFGFETVTLRSTDTGALAYAARVRHLDSNSGTQFHLPNESYERRSVWACDLDSIARYIKRGKAN